MHIDLKIKGLNEEIENLMNITGKLGDKATIRAIKSCAWFTQQKVKEYGRRGSRILWGRLNPHTPILKKYRPKQGKKEFVAPHYKQGKRKGQVIPKTSRSLKPFARIVNAPRYKVYGSTLEDAIAEIGFVGSARGLAGMISSHAVPAGIPVTERSRRYFFAVGFPLKKETKWLYRRKRPWIQPAFKLVEPHIVPRFEEKFISALKHYGVRFER